MYHKKQALRSFRLPVHVTEKSIKLSSKKVKYTCRNDRLTNSMSVTTAQFKDKKNSPNAIKTCNESKKI